MDCQLQFSPYLYLIGASWFPKTKTLPFWELNLHFLFIKFSVYWGYEDENFEINFNDDSRVVDMDEYIKGLEVK